MLLNGDGNANIEYSPDMGSLLNKFDTNNKLVQLDTRLHKKGNWDNWADQTKLMKFNVVLTNPPFGDNRKFEARTQREKEVAEFVGISIFYDFVQNGQGHHNQGMYRIENYPDDELKLISILLNSKKYRKLCGYASMGSKMKEMKIKDFSSIPFPIFDDNINNKLISNYNLILEESRDLIEIKNKLENYILDIANDKL